MSRVKMLAVAEAESIAWDSLLRATLKKYGTDPYAEFQKHYWDDPVGFVRHCMRWEHGEKPTVYQDELMGELLQRKRESVRSPHGTGKAMPCSLKIDTPTGKRSFGDLVVGDQIFGSDGQATVVTGIYEQGTKEIFRITFNDGSETLCSVDHLWTVRQFSWEARSADKTCWETLSLADLMEQGLDRSNGKERRARKWTIPTILPLQYVYRWVPVDPYTLGAWLGDGSRNNPRITNNDHEVGERVHDAGYSIREGLSRYRIGNKSRSGVFGVSHLMHGLRQLGVYSCTARSKFVPTLYLENIPEIRREVLRGLLDTDGTVTKEGGISFCSVSEQLANDVAWLSRSLGGMARLHERKNKNGPFFTVSLTLPEGRWFYIQRKQVRVKSISQKRYLRRWINDVQLVGTDDVRCISVAAPDGLYVANDAIVTHNTAVAAWLVLWFSLTRDGQDWKTITTASAWRQLREYLWPEVHKWAKRLRWDRVGRPAFDEQRELLKLNLTLSTGSAFAVASDNAAWIEGAHADHLLYIFDEAKVIPGMTWDAVEGAFSTPGEVLAFSISTPGEPNGRFYDIQSRKPGYEDWHVRHIRLDEALAARRMSEDWVSQRRLQWGEQAAVYQNRVLGEFASSEEDGVIPLAWVEMAVERWHENHDGDFTGVGVDVARGGADKSCLALRHGNVIAELRYYSKEDTMSISGRVAGILKEHGGWASVDVIGVGAGVVDRLAEEGYDVESYNAAERTDRKDRSGELGFVNRRSAGWWTLRELLDPANGENIALPPDDLLVGDLTAPKWRVVSGGRIQIESKDDIKKRLGRSTDAGDAVMQAFDHNVLDRRLPYSWMLRGAK